MSMSISFADTDDSEYEIMNIIEEAEKIIAENRRGRASTNVVVDDNQRQIELQSIRDDLNNFLSPSLPVDNDVINNIIQEHAESPTSPESLSISTTSSNISSTNEDIVLISDSSTSDIPIIDLCTPNNRRRCRRQNRSIETADIIEIDDYQPYNKRASLDVKPPINCNKLNTPQNTDTNIDCNKNIIICPICLESTVNRQPKSTKCGHVYCNECIRHSLKISKKCPLCKKPCTEKHLITLYL